MFTSNENIVIATIIISTSLIVIFAIIVVIAIIKYRNKQREFIERESTIENELVKAKLEAEEQKMRELAVRIHIDLQQSLSLVKLNLNKVLNNTNEIDIRHIIQSKELITKTLEEVKDLSKDLDTNYITRYTLEENIVRQLDRVKKQTNLETMFNTSDEEISISKEKQIFIFRITQEAINNILAHAKATQIMINLKNNTTHFMVTIEDNGIGFDINSIKDDSSLGIGLMNMQSRTELIHGVFHLRSIPDQGTQISLKIPYDE